MKLPTLNIDVAINTAGLKKQAAEANRTLRTVGTQGLGLAGGRFGTTARLGALAGAAGLGAGMGSMGVGAGGIALAASLPIMSASMAAKAFAAATKEGTEAIKAFASGDRSLRGLALPFAASLANADDRAAVSGAMAGSDVSTFLGAGMNMHGQYADWSIMDLLSTWWDATVMGWKSEVAIWGATLGGKTPAEASRAADIATSSSIGAAQSYMTQEELREMNRLMEKQMKAIRESTT